MNSFLKNQNLNKKFDPTRRLKKFLSWRFPKLTINDIEISNARGYWYVKNGCKGNNECTHAFRGSIGCCVPGTRLTIYYAQFDRDEFGRFMSPFWVWNALKKKDEI